MHICAGSAVDEDNTEHKKREIKKKKKSVFLSPNRKLSEPAKLLYNTLQRTDDWLKKHFLFNLLSLLLVSSTESDAV